MRSPEFCTLQCLVLVTATCLVSACVTAPVIEDTPASAPVDPISLPDWSVGMKRVTIDPKSGEKKGYEITQLLPDGKLRAVSLAKTEGEPCSWTGSVEWFIPSESWQNCGGPGEWNSGTHIVKQLSGESLWPLTTGTKAEYRKTPISSQGTRGTPEIRKCEVMGPVTVTVALGDFDAMKVRCVTRRWDGAMESRIWYWNAEHGQIKYVRLHSKDGVKDESEIGALVN